MVEGHRVDGYLLVLGVVQGARITFVAVTRRARRLSEGALMRPLSVRRGRRPAADGRMGTCARATREFGALGTFVARPRTWQADTLA